MAKLIQQTVKAEELIDSDTPLIEAGLDSFLIPTVAKVRQTYDIQQEHIVSNPSSSHTHSNARTHARMLTRLHNPASLPASFVCFARAAQLGQEFSQRYLL